LVNILERHGMKIGMVMQALRLAVTGAEAGPDLMQIIEVIGREETANRIDAAISALSQYATA
jgi:glutamyl-tRNA synthetase